MYSILYRNGIESVMHGWLEAESNEKHGVWGPMPELTIPSPYVHSRVNSNTFTMGNPMPESTLFPSQGLWNWPLNTGASSLGP
jgi:hypothetical protein